MNKAAAPKKNPRRRLPRSFKDLTPAKHFNPGTFFRELVWKALLTPRHGEQQRPVFPKLKFGEVAITWIGHASFLIQFTDLNVLIDPNFANWLFLLKRIKRAGFKIKHLPPIDVVLLTHDHWESFSQADWKVTFTPSKHWGARTLRDSHRGYGGFVLEHQGRKIYHAGDSAYFDGFKEIGRRLPPEIALLPIGAYHPESFRRVHMAPDQAIKAFKDLGAQWLVPMHYGTFRLSFEDMDEPPRWLLELAKEEGITRKIRILEEGVPVVF